MSGGKGHAGKPCLVVIIQDDRFEATNSITICGMTTDATGAPLMRILLVPNDNNGFCNRTPAVKGCRATAF